MRAVVHPTAFRQSADLWAWSMGRFCPSPRINRGRGSWIAVPGPESSTPCLGRYLAREYSIFPLDAYTDPYALYLSVISSSKAAAIFAVNG